MHLFPIKKSDDILSSPFLLSLFLPFHLIYFLSYYLILFLLPSPPLRFPPSLPSCIFSFNFLIIFSLSSSTTSPATFPSYLSSHNIIFQLRNLTCPNIPSISLFISFYLSLSTSCSIYPLLPFPASSLFFLSLLYYPFFYFLVSSHYFLSHLFPYLFLFRKKKEK